MSAQAMPEARGRYGRIAKAVWAGGAAKIVTSGVSLLTLPLAVRYLGAGRYGVWATITTTAVCINLLDLGIANTLTNEISRAFALADKEAARRYFTNALALTCAAAGAAGLGFALVFRHVNWAGLLNVGASISSSELAQTIAVAVAFMLLALPCNLGSKLLAGYQELHRYAYATGAGALASVMGLAIGIALRVRMPALYIMSLGCMTFTSFFMLLFILWQKPWLLPRLSCINLRSAKELLSSGSAFFLIQLSAVVVFSSDNVIVSHYLGPTEVTPYSITWRLAGVAAILQSLIFPALWPAYTEAYARGDIQWIRKTFATTMRWIVVLNLLCAGALILLGRDFIHIWAGAAAVPRFSLLCAMAVWIVVNGFMSVESCLLAALNRTRGQAMLSVCAAVMNIALSLVLVHHIGALGVIGGTILSYMAILVVPQSLIVRNVWRRELRKEGILDSRLLSAFRHEAE